MQGPQAYIGACAPATLAGPIHRTRVHCWPQNSQQYPSVQSLPSSVVAGSGRPPRANAAIPGITLCCKDASVSTTPPRVVTLPAET